MDHSIKRKPEKPYLRYIGDGRWACDKHLAMPIPSENKRVACKTASPCYTEPVNAFSPA